mmetsp:Transcript_9872/g.11399  ORF Transcript_9872/g.11399 Transcript_9872/m.11399 type:complete len:329 (+) Transcript_9872:174-1160(+)
MDDSTTLGHTQQEMTMDETDTQVIEQTITEQTMYDQTIVNETAASEEPAPEDEGFFTKLYQAAADSVSQSVGWLSHGTPPIPEEENLTESNIATVTGSKVLDPLLESETGESASDSAPAQPVSQSMLAAKHEEEIAKKEDDIRFQRFQALMNGADLDSLDPFDHPKSPGHDDDDDDLQHPASMRQMRTKEEMQKRMETLEQELDMVKKAIRTHCKHLEKGNEQMIEMEMYVKEEGHRCETLQCNLEAVQERVETKRTELEQGAEELAELESRAEQAKQQINDNGTLQMMSTAAFGFFLYLFYMYMNKSLRNSFFPAPVEPLPVWGTNE